MNTRVVLRPARQSDVAALHALIAENLEAGHLLPRSVPDLEQHAPRFVVADVDGQVVGCGELATLSDRVAEVRSLVVHEAWRGQQIAGGIVRHLSNTALAGGFATLCAFTHDPRRFVRLGFSIVPHVWVPEKIARDCTSCALFRRCGQYAVTLALRAGVRVEPLPPAAVIHAGRAVAPRRLNVERLQLRLAAADRVDETEAVPA